MIPRRDGTDLDVLVSDVFALHSCYGSGQKLLHIACVSYCFFSRDHLAL